jgi:hypothetical protein
MSTAGIVIIVVLVVIVLAVVGWFVAQDRRRRQLRERFGPEYDRTVDEQGNRRDAERELTLREERHAKLDIKPLSNTDRDRYAQQWTLIQQQFVDRPEHAVVEADRLVTVVMGERGYPTEGYHQQVSDLSVRHANTLDHYRSAHAIKTRNDDSRVATEELREAMVHYRSLFEDLLESDVDGRNGRDGHHGTTRN